jgi:hypothetical protein
VEPMIVGEDLPQLRGLLWNRSSLEVTEEEALALYESNRGWVNLAAMTERERRFFEDLLKRHGRGIFLG